MNSLAYLLGRKSAPLFFKADWVMKFLTGTDSERIEAEFTMGSLLARAYEQQVPCIASNRLSDIANQLLARLKNKERKHSFKLDQSGDLNACAIPGGFIYLSESLFDLCGEDTDAIAFVLAHEIAHGIHGDANKRFLTEAVINGLLHVRTAGLSPQIKRLLGQLIRQGYSREHEFRADRFAVALTHAAGFDPLGGCRLFTELDRRSRQNTPFGAYFSSHPPMQDRIRKIQDRADSLQKT